MVAQQGVAINASQATANLELKQAALESQIVYINNYSNGDVLSAGTISVDNSIARYDGIGGKTIQGAGPTIDDLNNIKGAASVGATAGIAFGSGANGALTLTSTLYNNPSLNGKFLQLNSAGVLTPADAASALNTFISSTSAVTIGTSAVFDVNIISNNKNILTGKTNGLVSEVTLGSTSDVNVIYLNGSVEYNYKLMAGTGGIYSITDDDYFVKFTGTAAFTVNLLTATASGRTIMLRNSTTLSMTVSPLAGQNIGGSGANYIVPAGATIKLMADGTDDWILI
jgi:hypothetical protein